MPELRAVVADDEPLVRRGIARFLVRYAPDVRVVAEAGDGREMVRAVEEHWPDLLFLDVQMPELDGFEALERVERERQPAVVFITAFHEHALRAFDVHAVDYLLKPFDDERLGRALERARQRLARPAAERRGELHRLLEDLRAGTIAPRIAVHSGSRTTWADVDAVDWIEADGNYAVLHRGSKRDLVRETLASLDARLAPFGFARVHRSALVRLDRVGELHSLPSGDAWAVLRNGTRVRVSRSYREAFERRMAGG